MFRRRGRRADRVVDLPGELRRQTDFAERAVMRENFQLAEGLASMMSAHIGASGVTGGGGNGAAPVAPSAQRVPSGMLSPRLNQQARDVVAQALREALQAGHNYIGPEHLRAALDRLHPNG